MTNAPRGRPKSGDRVVLIELPPGLLDELPTEDQEAISAIVGKTVVLNEYDDVGRAELEFNDAGGNIHLIYVNPEFIRVA